mmetsp:Transcript_5637/g.10044  ORF Transcript_5637/g.10044 Transcript_5637/m.10044 type:complete len:139 (+) Transcript_5637:37-453(+)
MPQAGSFSGSGANSLDHQLAVQSKLAASAAAANFGNSAAGLGAYSNLAAAAAASGGGNTAAVAAAAAAAARKAAAPATPASPSLGAMGAPGAQRSKKAPAAENLAATPSKANAPVETPKETAEAKPEGEEDAEGCSQS